MANSKKYLNHLLQRTEITPACSEEERAAADVIARISPTTVLIPRYRNLPLLRLEKTFLPLRESYCLLPRFSWESAEHWAFLASCLFLRWAFCMCLFVWIRSLPRDRSQRSFSKRYRLSSGIWPSCFPSQSSGCRGCAL